MHVRAVVHASIVSACVSIIRMCAYFLRRYVKPLPEVQEHTASVESKNGKMIIFRNILSPLAGETEKDLFRLTVVNSYGSQEIKKLVDNPQKILQLSGM